MTGILEQLKWESLKKRRTDDRHILLHKGLKGKARLPTDDLIPKTRRCRNSHSKAFQLPSASTEAYKCNKVVSFPRLSGTGMTSLTLCFLLLKCQMIVCPSLLHSCVLGTYFSPIRTPGEIISFGVSPVNYSDCIIHFHYLLYFRLNFHKRLGHLYYVHSYLSRKIFHWK